jgi:phage terminase large subunit GpA-like protein
LIYPDGYCHHGGWLDEVFFRQITAESLQDIRFRGRVTGREWVKNGPNHYLDCYVGNHALGEYLGLSSTTKEQWAALAAVRGMPQTLVESDLFTVSADKTPPAPVAPPSAPIVARETPKNNGWLGHRKGWLNK